MIFTEEDKKLVKKFISIKNRGLYVDSMQLTEAYNRILEKNVRNTTCGSCMRARVSELENALKQWEKQEIKAQEELKEAEANNTQEPLKEANTEAVKEEKENGTGHASKPKGRPKKGKGTDTKANG